MRHVLQECYPQHLLPTLILNGWPEFQTFCQINMPKYPFCKAACDNSAHQCLSGESFPWTSGQPMVFLSIQSLEPLQSFFWDCLAEFIVWSATAETQNTSKYNPWKLVHRWSVVASWEPAKKRLGPNAQVAQPANGIRQQKHLNTTLGHSASLPFSLASFCGRKQGLGDGEDWSF